MTIGILTKLLSRGMLPIQLPPGYSSETFASNLSQFQGRWEELDKELDKKKKTPTCLAEKFSVPRSSYYRRNTSIVNPISYYFLSREIADLWPKIEAHYNQSPLSLSIPTISESLRAIHLRRFSELHEDKVISAAGYQYAVVTDITSYFPTLYTHTISWALHGKLSAKRQRRRKNPSMYGNDLDYRCQALQDGQTIGIPIGPDTSHILAEIIGVAMDLRLNDELKYWPAGFRYVDDFFLFFNSRDDAERALAAVIKAVNSFELQINPSKTRIIEAKDLVGESWKYSVKRLSISSPRKQQREDIHHYFESLFLLEKKFRDESLIKYGLKQISSTIIKKSNWSLFEAYLLKCGYGFPNTIQVIAQILATYNYHGYFESNDAIKRFCNNLIRSNAAADRHGEVAWLLWICKELKIDVDVNAASEVERMASSVCTLILLYLYHSGLVAKITDTSALKSYADKNALRDSKWLLAYEAGRRDWLGLGNTTYIDDDVFFGPLKAAGVWFYDENKLYVPIFDFKETQMVEDAFDFDTDDPIEDKFEFDEMDEEYFDKSTGPEDFTGEDEEELIEF
jgi:hypothetical protein